MGLLVPLASLFGIEVKALIDDARRNAIAMAAVALFGLIAFCFLLVAAQLALSMVMPPLFAALTIAGVSAVIAIAIFSVIQIVASRRKRREAERRRSSETTALVTTAALTALPLVFKSPLMRNIGLPLVGLLTLAFSASGKGSDKDKD